MKKICESLREDTMKIINFKKKKMKSLTKEQKELYENANIWYICKEKFENKYVRDKNIVKLEIIAIIQGKIMCIKKFLKLFIMDDYHFTVKESAEKFEKQFTFFFFINV